VRAEAYVLSVLFVAAQLVSADSRWVKAGDAYPDRFRAVGRVWPWARVVLTRARGAWVPGQAAGHSGHPVPSDWTRTVQTRSRASERSLVEPCGQTDAEAPPPTEESLYEQTRTV
jgi:hypothetical protein